jgi:hypothetical protein
MLPVTVAHHVKILTISFLKNDYIQKHKIRQYTKKKRIKKKEKRINILEMCVGSLDHCLSFCALLWPLYCLSDLLLVMTPPLVLSN